MDALFCLALVLGLVAFDLLALRFGADSRDLTRDLTVEGRHA